MDIAEVDYFKSLAERLESCPPKGGERGKLVVDAMNFLGVSRQKVYRKLREYAGWSSGRKLRSDKGDSCITDEELQILSSMMVEATRANGKQLLGIDDALEIARENNLIQCDVTGARVLRVMRQRGFHPDQINKPSAAVELASKHPNHTWQFDVSTCVLFYLPTGGLAVMDENRFYKNKMENLYKIKNERVQRYLAVDHTTGALKLKYYLRPGEDTETIFNFLVWAMQPSGHKQDPVHGVPFHLIWDCGAANMSKLMLNFLQGLMIQHWEHMPGNPRAKGMVEGAHNIVERKFESRLSFMKVRDVDHLNECAQSWARHFQGTFKHSRHGHTRFAAWQMIKSHELRLCPSIEVCRGMLKTEPEARTVKDQVRITFKGKGFEERLTYSVAHVPNVRIGEKVNVCVNPYNVPFIYVVVENEEGRKEFIECEPLSNDEWGFTNEAVVIGEEYKKPVTTESEKRKKAMAKEAYGVEADHEVAAARKNNEPAFGGKIDPISYLDERHVTDYMQRKGTDMEVEAPIPAKPITVLKAVMLLEQIFNVDITPEKIDWIKGWYPENEVLETELPEIVERLSKQESRPQLRIVKEA